MSVDDAVGATVDVAVALGVGDALAAATVGLAVPVALGAAAGVAEHAMKKTVSAHAAIRNIGTSVGCREVRRIRVGEAKCYFAGRRSKPLLCGRDLEDRRRHRCRRPAHRAVHDDEADGHEAHREDHDHLRGEHSEQR